MPACPGADRLAFARPPRVWSAPHSTRKDAMSTEGDYVYDEATGEC